VDVQSFRPPLMLGSHSSPPRSDLGFCVYHGPSSLSLGFRRQLGPPPIGFALWLSSSVFSCFAGKKISFPLPEGLFKRKCFFEWGAPWDFVAADPFEGFFMVVRSHVFFVGALRCVT